MLPNQSLAELDEVALAEAALLGRRQFKKIVAELDTRKPSAAAAQRVIAAFRGGRCAPWLAACLLGSVRHDAGYAIAKEILLSNPNSQSSESYAGCAMAFIAGNAAYDDLRKILFGSHPPKVRQGAMYGMTCCSDPRLCDDLLRAHQEDRFRRTEVAQYIAKSKPSDEWLLASLRNEDLRLRKLAAAVIEAMIGPHSDGTRPGIAIAAALRDLLDDAEFSTMPSRRERLSAWVDEALRCFGV